MDAKPSDPSRKTRQTGIRLFEDQFDDLKWLAVHKHRNRRKVASLFREAVDLYIESEKNGSK
jgi:predicted DNA-binding protein